jgi:hypothetical protein
MSHIRGLKHRLFFVALPDSRSEISRICNESKARIREILQKDLAAKQLTPRSEALLFRRVEYAWLTHKRLSGEDRDKYISALMWTTQQRDELARVKTAANALVDALSAMQPTTRVRLRYSPKVDTDFSESLRAARRLAKAATGAIETQPPVTANRRPDFCTNAVVAQLATAWSSATAKRISRSTNDRTTPHCFILRVCSELGISMTRTKVDSAIHWFLGL